VRPHELLQVFLINKAAEEATFKVVVEWVDTWYEHEEEPIHIRGRSLQADGEEDPGFVVYEEKEMEDNEGPTQSQTKQQYYSEGSESKEKAQSHESQNKSNDDKDFYEKFSEETTSQT